MMRVFPFLRRMVLACAVAGGLSACGSLSTWEASVSDVDGLPGDLDIAVDMVAGRLVRDGETPGMVVGLLLPDGSTRFFGFGTTERGGGIQPGRDTLFAVGSLSKGFLGAMTSMAVGDGLLGWDETLATLLPPGTPLSHDAAHISVEQLATHTSGLPRQPMTARTLGYFVQYLFTGDNFYRHLDAPALLGYLEAFEAPSGAGPVYSNIGYGILGHVLERRAGKTLDTLLAERITGPLGLHRTGYDPERLPGWEERAVGHAGDQPKFIPRGDRVPDWRMTEILRGSASLYSSAGDLLAFVGAHLERNGSSRSVALADTLRMRVPRPRGAAGVAWVADDVEGVLIRYQVGIIAGYTSYLALNEANGTGVVVLQNAFNWDYSAGQQLMLLLARLHPAREPDAIRPGR